MFWLRPKLYMSKAMIKKLLLKGPWVFYNDEAAAAFVELSDSTEDDSDDDWRTPYQKKKKKAKHARRRRRGSNIRKRWIFHISAI